MKHFVCTECGSTQKSPGVCENDNCIQQGAPLVVCNCSDGKHASVMNTWREEPENPAVEGEEIEGRNIKTLDLDS